MRTRKILSTYIPMGCVLKEMDSPTTYETVHRTVSYLHLVRAGLSNPDTDQKKNEDRPNGQSSFLVGVSGFELWYSGIFGFFRTFICESDPI
jgi:hypothetical protein